MEKTREEYLKIMYPDETTLSESEKKKCEYFKRILDTHFDEFDEMYKNYKGFIGEYTEQEILEEMSTSLMKKYDNYTIIENYVKEITAVLNTNSYISNHFDDFLKIMRQERVHEEEHKYDEIDETPIAYSEVVSLVREFLVQMDPSLEMLNEFNKMNNENRIVFGEKSQYVNGTIKYHFGGTVIEAPTLLHEFMHHWNEVKSNIDMNRETHTMFIEFESLYYEKAFAEFMKAKGFLKNGTGVLINKRYKQEYDKDVDNSVVVLLELCNIMRQKGEIEEYDVIDVLRKFKPVSGEEAFEKESEKLVFFCKEHPFLEEVVSGPIMYRFNNELAANIPIMPEAIKSVHTLSSFLQDTQNDHVFMHEYLKLLERLKELEREKDGIIDTLEETYKK